MSEGVELRKCSSFDRRDRRLQEMKQYCDEQCHAMEQNYECKQCNKMERQIDEHSKEIQQMQSMIKELLKDMKDLQGQDVREISKRGECSINLKQNVSCSPESSNNECSKQTYKSCEGNRKNHVVEFSMGKN